jgi:hypothetical protein
MALSGQVMAQNWHAVQALDESTSGYGTPWELAWSESLSTTEFTALADLGIDFRPAFAGGHGGFFVLYLAVRHKTLFGIATFNRNNIYVYV